jgi:cytochrome c-type biogenesis protein CcmH/NrfG
MTDRIAQLQNFIEARPDDPFPRYALALEHRGRGELPAAAAALQELVRRAPAYVPSYLMLGQLLVSLDRLDEARAAFAQGQAQARAAGERHALSELTDALEEIG